MTYSAEVLADSPLVYLQLDETSGTTAVDSSGNGRDMTSAGCTVNQATLMPNGSKSYDFPGSTSQISLADAAWQRPTAFTIEAWIQQDVTTSFKAIAAKDGSGSGWAFYSIDGKLSLYTNGTAHTDIARIVAGTTYHVAATYDTGAIKIYLNGSQVYSTTGASLTQTSGTALLVGVSTGSNGGATRTFRFDGRLDEVAYYGTALSGARISAHYDAGTSAGTAASGTASLTLAASGDAGSTAVGTGSLSLSASGAAAVEATGTAALSLSAAGALVAPEPASGTAALSLSADASALAAGAGSASLDLSATGAATLGVSGAASLTLSAVGSGSVLYDTDTSNLLNGRDRGGSAAVTVTQPVEAPPASLVLATKVDKAIAYPAPVMVKGRPT